MFSPCWNSLSMTISFQFFVKSKRRLFWVLGISMTRWALIFNLIQQNISCYCDVNGISHIHLQDPPDPQLMRLDNMLIAEVGARTWHSLAFTGPDKTWPINVKTGISRSNSRVWLALIRTEEPLGIPHRSLRLVAILKIQRVSGFLKDSPRSIWSFFWSSLKISC